MTIDADFFRQRLAEELARFTPLAVEAVVGAIATAGGSEYAALLGAGGACGCPSHGDGGEEHEGGGREQRPPDG